MATCRVYGQGSARFVPIDLPTVQEPSRRSLANSVPLTAIAQRDLLCARPDLEIASVVRLMVSHRIGCLPVVDELRRPIGMITKFDIVEQLDSMMQSNPNGSPLPQQLSARTAEEAMMPLAFVLDERATVAHAATIMHVEGTHHVLVVRSTGELIGVISSKDIVEWMITNEALDQTLE
jgi:CBS domain-containing protein